MKVRAEIKTILNGYNTQIKAIANVVIDECFVIKSVRIIEGQKGLFVTMPSIKRGDSSFMETCHPITSDCKEKIDVAVLTAYEDFFLINR